MRKRLSEIETESIGISQSARDRMRQLLAEEAQVWALIGRRLEDRRSPHADCKSGVAASDDRRDRLRRRTARVGKILQSDGVTHDCVIRNINEVGALVRVAAVALLPSTIDLIDIRGGLAFAATVVWRHLPSVGLRFDKAFDLSQPDAPAGLRRLWIDCTER